MKNNKRLWGILFFLFVFTNIPAQEEFKIQDPEKHFSTKEKQIFERAIHYEATFYDRIFPDKKIDFSAIKLTVVPNPIAFALYVSNSGSNVHKNSPGVYFPSKRELVVCTAKKYRKTFVETACHELSHAFLHLHSGGKTIPAWLNEGLAVYLQKMTFGKKKITQRVENRHITRVKTLIDLKDLNLSEFVSWNYQKFSFESFTQEGYGYAVGYCMVLFLMQRDENNAITIFRNLIGEQTSIEVFDNNYPGGFAHFEKDFMEYFGK
jgi:uncharacterized protein YjaZ